MPDSASGKVFVRPGFRWDTADAYLFDIDGTLLNSRDAVHYFAFHNAAKEVLGIEANIEGVPVHGNTDVGILRAVLQRAGLENSAIDASMPAIVAAMCAEVERNREQLRPELCPSILELLSRLKAQGKLLGAASGNLETIGWLKLEKAGIRPMFSFGSFSFPQESRTDIFQHGVDIARQQLGAHASVTAVGDTPADVQAARAIGIPVITLATGIFSFADLMAHSPDACLGWATDLLALPS
ncbi:MAG TPA: HAD hydrolase-like protein [Candidatus Angelobacter sp.]|nr:HAD hydrolase-like protein [Candidatus Angelobacter sp.]